MTARGGALRAAAAALVLAGACATFEDPTVVIDLRVVGMTADPPEQVIDVDLSDPQTVPQPDELLAQLSPTRVCAHVADPGAARELAWSMRACLLTEDYRCDPARPSLLLGAGALADPDAAPQGGRACSLIEYDADPAGWLALLADALEGSPTRGLGGLDYAVELRIGDPAVDPALDVFAVKQVRISARLPANKVANQNPRITGLQISRPGVGGQGAPAGRCADVPDPFEVAPRSRVTLFPLEPGEDTANPAREEFTLPTLDGGFETFTETISYQWLVGAGSITDPITGGPPDIFGNQTLLGTEWTAPGTVGSIDVPVWLVQRDERYGVSVYEHCIRVAAP